MSEHTHYQCSCIDVIEEDVINYLDNKPEITEIQKKAELEVKDVIELIKLINFEILNIEIYYRMESEIEWIDRQHMKEEYLDEAGFPYNIHRRNWYNNPCPSYKEEIEVEEEVVRDSRNHDDYYIQNIEYTHVESCYHYPGFNTIIIDCMKTYLYNKLSSGIINKYLHYYIDTNKELKELLSAYEEKIAKSIDTYIYSRKWKGSWFYFYKIFRFPKYFCSHYHIFDNYQDFKEENKLIKICNKNKNIVDISKCKKEYNNNFKAMIEGHPLASNGIFQDGLQELEELGCC